MRSKVIAVDFDGTVVQQKYPYIGEELPNCVNVLKKLNEKGHRIILLTMRDGQLLDEAVQWFLDRYIDLWSVNSNPDQKYWTKSQKVYANFYIDDTALGCP